MTNTPTPNNQQFLPDDMPRCQGTDAAPCANCLRRLQSQLDARIEDRTGVTRFHPRIAPHELGGRCTYQITARAWTLSEPARANH